MTYMSASPTPTAIVARNSIYQLIFKVATVALSMVTFSLVARFLSVEQFGEFTLISTIFALLIGFSDLRIEQIVVREASNNAKKLPHLAFNASLTKLVFSLLVVGAAWVFVWFSNYSSVVKLGVVMASAGVLFNAIQVGFHAAIQHSLRAYLLTLAEVVAKVFVAGLVAIIFWLGMRGILSDVDALHSFVIVLLVASPLIVLLCYAYWSTKSIGYKVSWTVDFAVAKSLLRQSWPLWIMGLLALIHYRADVLILSWLKSEYDVGIYGLAYRVLDVTVTLPPLSH